MTGFNQYKELAEEIRDLHPRTKLYDFLKRELKARGHWKNKTRKRPKK